MEGSQVSLPRSYTLPREFKYNNSNNTVRERERRAGNNKVPPSRFYLPSTNSSDGEWCPPCPSSFLFNQAALTSLSTLIMSVLGDVDSADNEDETDSEAQMRTRANHVHNHDDALQRRHIYENNGGNHIVDINPECGASSNCYSNNFHGALRPNQLLRTRVKHETKL